MPGHPRRKPDRIRLESIRIQAVQEVLAGRHPQEAGREVGFSGRRVYDWLAKYRAGGWEALRARHIPGRPHRLTEAQQAWICETLVQKNPLHFNFASPLWTRAMVAALVREQFQIRLSLVSVGRLLRAFGFLNGKPWRPVSAEDRAQMEQWLRTDFKQIAGEARRALAEIIFLDVGICGSPSAPGRHLLSAVSRQGQIRFMVAQGPLEAAAICEFIRRLMHGAKRRVFLVVPAHPIYRERAVEECRASLDGRLRLFSLPVPVPAPKPTEAQPQTSEPLLASAARTAVHEPRRNPVPIAVPPPGLPVPPPVQVPQPPPSAQPGVAS